MLFPSLASQAHAVASLVLLALVLLRRGAGVPVVTFAVPVGAMLAQPWFGGYAPSTGARPGTW